jgi:mono/diheme cytochrome c family protein
VRDEVGGKEIDAFKQQRMEVNKMLRIGKIVAAAQLALVAFGLATTPLNDANPQDRLVMRGRELFIANCAMCHGINAQSHCPMVPSLVGVTQRMSGEEIIAHARGLADRMCCARHLKRLTDADFHAILAFLRTLAPNSGSRSHPMPEGGKMGNEGMNCPMMGGAMSHAPTHEKRTHPSDGKTTRTNPFPATQKVDGLTVAFSLEPSPPRVGENTLQVRLTDEKGRSIPDAQVQVSLSMPAMQMTGPTLSLRPLKDGTYTGLVLLGMEGAWRAEVTILRPGAKPVRASFDFLVPITPSELSDENKASPPPSSLRRSGCCG